MLFKPIELGIDKPTIRYIAGLHRLTYEEVLIVFQNILADTLTNTIVEVEAWIRKYVPKDTGALQDDLIHNLHMSQVVGSLFRLILGSSLDYAVFVNAMTKTQVAHSGEIRAGRVLYDPEAVGNFFQELYFYAKERVQINLKKAKALYLGYGKFSTQVKKAMG